MSWLFSRVLVEGYLVDICSDGEQSAQSSGSHIQLAYCAPDKMTKFSRLSQYGMTVKPLTETRGEELLMLYLAGFHAKTSAQPERVQESQAPGPQCGSTWLASLARLDPNTRSWKTAQCSLLEDSMSFSLTLPRWGLMQDGALYLQPTLVQTIKEIESGYWPTPNTLEGLAPKKLDRIMEYNNKSRPGRSYASMNLREQVVYGKIPIWPTPDANCGQRGTQPNWTPKRKSGQPAQYTINQAVRDKQTWPTPRSCSAMAATITPESAWNQKRNPNLETIMGQVQFPTPTAHNAKECNSPSKKNRNTPTLATHAGGKLNPDWVEWLMNWPIKWSDLNEFDPKEFERWQKTSATPLQKSVQMRTMWWNRDPSQTSHRSQHEQQYEQQHCDSLHQVSRVDSCESTLERSYEGQDLPVLRDSVHLQTTERENLQSGVWEQTCMDETQIVPRVVGTGTATVDRLKAIGNGQVPLCAATAWELLK